MNLTEAKLAEAQRLVGPYRATLAFLEADSADEFFEATGQTVGDTYVDPDAVAAAIAENLARHKQRNGNGHYFRFKKARPSIDTHPDAFTFRVCYEHARPGGEYLSVDSLFIARTFAEGQYSFEEWDRTVSLMARIARRTAQAARA